MRQLAASLVSGLFRSARLRRLLVRQVKQHHFRELGLRLPIGHGLHCPLHTHENVASFSEIFCQQEYAGLWEHIAPPARWLDLGAHAGYFTLSVAARHAQAGTAATWRAVLVEPDPRMREVIASGLELNRLGAQAQVLTGLVGSGPPLTRFALREGMLSSSVDLWGGKLIDVPRIDEATLLAALPPPYDLVKIDIEGSEYDFVRAYPTICASARTCVIEWHAPTADAPALAELVRTLHTHGLTRRITLRPGARCLTHGPRSFSGLDLFLRADARRPAS